MTEIPKEWKTAGAGEEELDYILFDLVASGTIASAKLTFFNHNEAEDGIQVSNMPMDAQLPSTQRFLVKGIELIVDTMAAVGDSAKVLDGAVIDFKINNERKISFPAIRCVSPVTTNITKVDDTGGAVGYFPFELEKALVIDGGVPFAVEMVIGKTAVSASTDLTVLLRGRLVRKE